VFVVLKRVFYEICPIVTNMLNNLPVREAEHGGNVTRLFTRALVVASRR
jgi:hypothetical protein